MPPKQRDRLGVKASTKDVSRVRKDSNRSRHNSDSNPVSKDILLTHLSHEQMILVLSRLQLVVTKSFSKEDCLKLGLSQGIFGAF